MPSDWLSGPVAAPVPLLSTGPMARHARDDGFTDAARLLTMRVEEDV